MLFIRNDILAEVVSTDDRPIESFYVELNFRNKKWLLNCSCNPKHSSIESHLDSLSKSIDSLSSNNCEEVEEEPNNFFANGIKNRNILNYENCDSLAENIDDPTL